jgi:hypothetical protein
MDFSGHSVSSIAVLDAANDAAQQALFLIGIAADSRFLSFTILDKNTLCKNILHIF